MEVAFNASFGDLWPRFQQDGFSRYLEKHAGGAYYFMVPGRALLWRASIVERTLSLSLAAGPSTYNILLCETKWGAYLLLAATKPPLVTWTSCASWLPNLTMRPARSPSTPLVLLVAKLCLSNRKTRMLVLDMLQVPKSWTSLRPRSTCP